MSVSAVDKALQFELVKGEQRATLHSHEGVISYAVLPAKSSRAKGTIVLLHGVASNASRWEEFVEKTTLHEEWRLVRFDLRAHGASVSSVAATLEVHADDILALIDALDEPKVVLLGHSLGAQIAMFFAKKYPQRVQALLLLDPLVNEALSPKALGMRRRVPCLSFFERFFRLTEAIGLKRTLRPYSLRQHDRKARAMIRAGGAALEAFLKEYSSPFVDLKHIHCAPYLRDLIEVARPSPALSDLDAPVLVIASSAGTYTMPDLMAEWVKRIPKGEVCAVKCYHWPMTECPQEVSRVIVEWIKKTL